MVIKKNKDFNFLLVKIYMIETLSVNKYIKFFSLKCFSFYQESRLCICVVIYPMLFSPSDPTLVTQIENIC